MADKETSTREPYIYIARSGRDGKPLQYFVRAPRPEDGFWPIRYFNTATFGADEALRLARECRDDYVRLSSSLPSGIAYSSTESDLDAQEREAVRHLFNFQQNNGVVRLSTLALLGVFNNHHFTVREIAETLGREPGNIARQIRLLTEKGWLESSGKETDYAYHARTSQIYTISDAGLSVLQAFRHQNENTRIPGKNHYAELYDTLARDHRYASPNTVALLQLFSHNISAPSKIAMALDVGMAEASTAISRCAKQGYLSPSKGLMVTGGGQPGYKRPVYEVSDAGRDLLALAGRL